MNRREFMRTAGGTTATAAVGSAATGSAAAQEEEPDWGSWFDNANGGTYQDARGQDEVTISVGAGGDGLEFDPTGVWIDPGTTVTWQWTGNGGGHNVVTVEGEADLESEIQDSEGATYEHEFTEEEAGITHYECQPHSSVGMHGGVAVGEDVPVAEAGSTGGWPEEVHDIGVSLHPHWVGLVSTTGIMLTIVFTFYVLKYGESAHAGHGGR